MLDTQQNKCIFITKLNLRNNQNSVMDWLIPPLVNRKLSLLFQCRFHSTRFHQRSFALLRFEMITRTGSSATGKQRCLFVKTFSYRTAAKYFADEMKNKPMMGHTHTHTDARAHMYRGSDLTACTIKRLTRSVLFFLQPTRWLNITQLHSRGLCSCAPRDTSRHNESKQGQAGKATTGYRV